MALSKKDQINIKLEYAKETLAAGLRRLDALLARDDLTDKERTALTNERRQCEIQLAGIFKLYEGLKKKQSARMVLAYCEGELKDGTPCEYKIRASMSTYLRGVPCCPDPMCNRKSKPFTVQEKDADIEQAIADMMEGITPEQQMQDEVSEAKRRDAQEKERAKEAGLKRFDQKQYVSEPRKESPRPLDASFSQDDSAMFYDEGERKPSEEERSRLTRKK